MVRRRSVSSGSGSPDETETLSSEHPVAARAQAHTSRPRQRRDCFIFCSEDANVGPGRMAPARSCRRKDTKNSAPRRPRRPLSSPRSDSGPFSAQPQTALRPTTPDHPTGRGQPSFLLSTTRRRPLAKLRPATLRPTFRRPAASHRPSAALLPAADPSPSRCRTAARRANAARTCFCLFLRAACTIFVALPGPHLARPLHGRPGAGHKPLSPA